MTAVRFPTFSTSTATLRLNIRNGIGPDTAGAVIETTSANLTANTLFNRDVRVVWTITGSPTITFAVFMFVNPDGGVGL